MRLWKKAVMLTLAAVTLASGFAVASVAGVAVPGTQTQPAYADYDLHLFSMSGDMSVFDDEVIRRRDKRCPHVLNARGDAQQPDRASVALHDTDNKCGGEVRVEIRLSAEVRGNDPVDPSELCVKGEARLYEGTKDTSGDLDGTREIPERCGSPGEVLAWPTDQVNNDAEGGDYGRYTVRVSLN